MINEIKTLLNDSKLIKDEAISKRQQAAKIARKLIEKDNADLIKKLESLTEPLGLHIDEFGMLNINVGNITDFNTRELDKLMDDDFVQEILQEIADEYLCATIDYDGNIMVRDGDCIVVSPDFDSYGQDCLMVYNSQDINKVEYLDKDATHEEIQDAIKKVAGDGYYPNVVEILDKYGYMTFFNCPWKEIK